MGLTSMWIRAWGYGVMTLYNLPSWTPITLSLLELESFPQTKTLPSAKENLSPLSYKQEMERKLFFKPSRYRRLLICSFPPPSHSKDVDPRRFTLYVLLFPSSTKWDDDPFGNVCTFPFSPVMCLEAPLSIIHTFWLSSGPVSVAKNPQLLTLLDRL